MILSIRFHRIQFGILISNNGLVKIPMLPLNSRVHFYILVTSDVAILSQGKESLCIGGKVMKIMMDGIKILTGKRYVTLAVSCVSHIFFTCKYNKAAAITKLKSLRSMHQNLYYFEQWLNRICNMRLSSSGPQELGRQYSSNVRGHTREAWHFT